MLLNYQNMPLVRAQRVALDTFSLPAETFDIIKRFCMPFPGNTIIKLTIVMWGKCTPQQILKYDTVCKHNTVEVGATGKFMNSLWLDQVLDKICL
jgi:hypothetical protein